MEKTHTPFFPLRSASWRAIAGNLRLVAGRALSDRRSLIVGLLLWVLFALFLALVQFSTPDLPDNDGFYHIKLAYLMRTQGLKPDFPWLPLSILNAREFYDHHFLFHVALMPFTFGDLRLGAKWAAVIFASLAFLSVWNLLKNQRIPFAWLWALGLVAVSEAFIYRMSITRAQSLSLAVLMLALDWLLRGRYRRLAFLAFAYVWLYDAFPLLVVIAGVYVVAAWMIERRFDLRPLVYVGLGTGLGLIINPYFPYNVFFAGLHILPKLFETTAVRVGNEWYPYETAQLLVNSALAVLAFVSGGLALGLNTGRMRLRTAFAFLLAGLFGLMLFQSRRFIEYFPAFSLVFAAFAWGSVFEASSRAQVSDTVPCRSGLNWLKRILGAHLPALLLVLILLPGAWLTFQAAQDSLRTSKPYQTYAGASAWLQANTPQGARVFQTDWDDFPRLFYYNTHNTYLIGLDPTYMLIYDPDLYDLWVDITRGDVEDSSTLIESDFGAHYVVSDLRHTGFMDAASRDPGLVEVYRDGDSVVYQTATLGAHE